VVEKISEKGQSERVIDNECDNAKDEQRWLERGATKK